MSDEENEETGGNDEAEESSGSAKAEENGGSDAEETIGTEEAREVLATNDAVAIDLRDEEEWIEGHVPAARRISADELSEVDDLPDQKLIIVCEEGDKSAEVAEKLRSDGRDAVALEGGMSQWRSDDLPMQPSHDPEEGKPI
jgi:rhodanese-related sulfurtransferase